MLITTYFLNEPPPYRHLTDVKLSRYELTAELLTEVSHKSCVKIEYDLLLYYPLNYITYRQLNSLYIITNTLMSGNIS